MQMTCPRCGKKGTLTLRLTISKGIRYHYYYVQHVFYDNKRKTKWCYLGKYKNLSNEVKEQMKKEDSYTQMYTQTTEKSENPRSILINENSQELNSRGSLAWFGRQTHNLECVRKKGPRPEVASSNPAPGTFSRAAGTHFQVLLCK